MNPSFGVGPAAVWASAVRAGIMASSSGSAIVAPTPRSTVRRDRCFFVMNIVALLGNCSCIALTRASLPSSAIAPALLYLGHPCPRRQLLLHCSTSGIPALVGNCSCIALPRASLPSSAIAPALLYLGHPCPRH